MAGGVKPFVFGGLEGNAEFCGKVVHDRVYGLEVVEIWRDDENIIDVNGDDVAAHAEGQ